MFRAGFACLGVVLCLNWASGWAAEPDWLKLLAAQPPLPALPAAARAKGVAWDGIDNLMPPRSIVPGDATSFLIELHQGSHPVRQWLLQFEAIEPAQAPISNSPPATVLYTSTGQKFEFPQHFGKLQIRILGPVEASKTRPSDSVQDQKTVVTVNGTFLGLGLDGASAALQRLHQAARKQGNGKVHFEFGIGSRPFGAEKLARGKALANQLGITLAEERSLAGGVPALTSYFETVQQTPGLDAILLKVIKLPPAWSWVSNWGIEPGIKVGYPAARLGPLSLPDWKLPEPTKLYGMPVAVTLNQHPALNLTLIVTCPQPPFLSGGGIVGFLAENPADPGNYLTLRLVSAHNAIMSPAAGSR